MSDYQHWYYINKDYEEDGPVSSDELATMVREGDIQRGTYVWTPELPEWVPASKVGGLFEEQSKQIVKPIADNSTSQQNGTIKTKEASFEVTASSSEQKNTKQNSLKKTGAKLKDLTETVKSGYLNRKPSGFLTQNNGELNPAHSNDMSLPIRQPSRPVTSPTVGQPLSTIPTPANTAPSQQASNPSSAAQPARTNGPVPMTAPVEIVPKPITSAHTIAQNIPGAASHSQPAPISSQNAIPAPRGQLPASAPTTPAQTNYPPPIPPESASSMTPIQQTPATSAPPNIQSMAAGANSIPPPNMPNAGPAGALPPAPIPPAAAAPPLAGNLPQIPPVGRSVQPFNQTPTSALLEADKQQDPSQKTPRSMSMEP